MFPASEHQLELPALAGHRHSQARRHRRRGRASVVAAGVAAHEAHAARECRPRLERHGGDGARSRTRRRPLADGRGRGRQQRVVLYASDDLHAWTLLSEFADPDVPAGPWECPDLFPLAVEGSDDVRWVLLVSVLTGAPGGGSGMRWWLGDFDGTTFTPEHSDWLDHGRDCYAAVTWNDAPDGRRVMIGWLSNWAYAHDTPSVGWRGAMTLPRDLTLVLTESGPRLCQTAAPELATYEHLDVLLRPGEVQELHGGALRISYDGAAGELGGRAGAGGVQRGVRVGLAGRRTSGRRRGGAGGVAGPLLGRDLRRPGSDRSELPGVPQRSDTIPLNRSGVTMGRRRTCTWLTGVAGLLALRSAGRPGARHRPSPLTRLATISVLPPVSQPGTAPRRWPAPRPLSPSRCSRHCRSPRRPLQAGEEVLAHRHGDHADGPRARGVQRAELLRVAAGALSRHRRLCRRSAGAHDQRRQTRRRGVRPTSPTSSPARRSGRPGAPAAPTTTRPACAAAPRARRPPRSSRAATVRLSVVADPARTDLCTAYRKDGSVIGQFRYRLNGHIGTQLSADLRYGVAAARVKFPQSRGQHGAFWLQPTAPAPGSTSPTDARRRDRRRSSGSATAAPTAAWPATSTTRHPPGW